MKNLAVFSLLFLSLIPGCTGSNQYNNTAKANDVSAVSNTPPVETKTPLNLSIPPEASITLAQFNEIKKGMSLIEVVKILGDEGELNVTEHTLTETRSWRGDKGLFYVTIKFQNNKVLSKSKIDLK